MLPEIELDDLRFQELVSEARTRIVRHSPDWTEHNVSDPGITLIELFAWLTDVLGYRINRVPDRLRESLLALVGVRLGEPQRAEADLRFLLEREGELTVPAGTAVSSPRAGGHDAVTFTTVEPLTVPGARLAALAWARNGDHKAFAAAGGRAEPPESDRAPFSRPPARGDAMLVGFDVDLSRLVVRVDVECAPAQAAGLDPDDAPLTWEASGPDGTWLPATLVNDETGGFLRGAGAITVELPAQTVETTVAGRSLHWLRCRVTERTPRGRRAGYARPPEIGAVSAAVIGGCARAVHEAPVENESLGVSAGVPGIPYPLHNRPVLELADGETLEVRAPGSSDWVAWEPVDSFSISGAEDRHFTVDRSSGEVRFGPAVRQPEGGWRRFGAVPPAGSALRFTRYRYGGGIAGNVAPRALSILPQPVKGVASATNPRSATGGVDAETVDAGRARAALEVRSRTRAVTAEDLERLALAASARVARAICAGGEDGTPVRLHLLPRIEPADRLLTIDELTPAEELMSEVATSLEVHRLLGSSIRLLPVRLRAVSIVTDVRVSPLADLERVQHDVAHALYVYLNPLIGGHGEGPGDGWPLGRVLNQGELFGIVLGIDGVEFVNILRMYETDLRTGEQAAEPAESHLTLAPDELIASAKHIVKAIHREVKSG